MNRKLPLAFVTSFFIVIAVHHGFAMDAKKEMLDANKDIAKGVVTDSPTFAEESFKDNEHIEKGALKVEKDALKKSTASQHSLGTDIPPASDMEIFHEEDELHDAASDFIVEFDSTATEGIHTEPVFK
jgi:hypothetical protein